MLCMLDKFSRKMFPLSMLCCDRNTNVLVFKRQSVQMFRGSRAVVLGCVQCSDVQVFERVHEFERIRERSGVREYERTSVRELGSLGFSEAFGSSRKGGREKHCAVEWVVKCAGEDVIHVQS